MAAKSLPYENATSGKAALLEIEKVVQRFGATSFGVMERYETSEIVIQFEHRGQRVHLCASAKGYAKAWLRVHPFSSRSRGSLAAYEQRALAQGTVAVYSILRDWIKGQVTAIECGVLSFEAAFLGQIMLPSGETVHQAISRADSPLALPGAAQ